MENKKWANLILMKGINQRGGPFAFDDTYVEFEFGGRYDWLDLSTRKAESPAAVSSKSGSWRVQANQI